MNPWSTPRGLKTVALLAILIGAAIPAHAEIIINEVLADPASDWDGDGSVDFKSDEWIELLNTGPETVDLAEYWLRDITGEDAHLRLYGTVAPGETAVFYGSEAVAWQSSQGLSTTGFSLNNSGDFVQLLRTIPGTVGPELELMFAISYDAHEAADDRSCGFDMQQVEWLLYDGMNPYGGDLEPTGTGCSPTPGLPNLCSGQVSNESISYGTLKAGYR